VTEMGQNSDFVTWRN